MEAFSFHLLFTLSSKLRNGYPPAKTTYDRHWPRLSYLGKADRCPSLLMNTRAALPRTAAMTATLLSLSYTHMHRLWKYDHSLLKFQADLGIPNWRKVTRTLMIPFLTCGEAKSRNRLTTGRKWFNGAGAPTELLSEAAKVNHASGRRYKLTGAGSGYWYLCYVMLLSCIIRFARKKRKQVNHDTYTLRVPYHTGCTKFEAWNYHSCMNRYTFATLCIFMLNNRYSSVKPHRHKFES